MFSNSFMSFVGFEPTNGFQLYTDALLASLLDLAPKNAAGHSLVRKTEQGYTCRLSIFSPVAQFQSISESERPQAALEHAQFQLFRQLARWRKRRRRKKTPKP